MVVEGRMRAPYPQFNASLRLQLIHTTPDNVPQATSSMYEMQHLPCFQYVSVDRHGQHVLLASEEHGVCSIGTILHPIPPLAATCQTNTISSYSSAYKH